MPVPVPAERTLHLAMTAVEASLPGLHKTWVLLPHLILGEAIQKPYIDLTQAILEAHLDPESLRVALV